MDIAETRDLSPAQIVLVWNQARGVIPIPASNDRDHIVENLPAARIGLDSVEQSRIDPIEDPRFVR